MTATMDPRTMLTLALMQHQPQSQTPTQPVNPGPTMPPGYQQVAQQVPGNPPMLSPQMQAKIAQLARINTDNAMALRGLPAAGSPATPFGGMTGQTIPLQ